MQGRIFIYSILIAGLSPTTALAADTIKRIPCAKDQSQQRQQAREPQQPRAKRQGCPVERSIPPVVDPTPFFLL